MQAMANFSFYKLLSRIGIVTTPLTPALLFASDIYTELKGVNYWPMAAILAAGVTVIGLESTGAISFHNTIEFFRTQEWGKAIFSLIMAMFYVGVVILGLSLMDLENSAIGIISVITVAAYAASGMQESGHKAEQEKQQAKEDKRLDAELEIKRINAEKNLLRAQALNQPQKVQESSETSQETFRNFPKDWRKLSQDQKDYLATLKDAKTIAKVVGFTEKSGENWYKRLHTE